jgi:hypothetical protein
MIFLPIIQGRKLRHREAIQLQRGRADSLPQKSVLLTTQDIACFVCMDPVP